MTTVRDLALAKELAAQRELLETMPVDGLVRTSMAAGQALERQLRILEHVVMRQDQIEDLLVATQTLLTALQQQTTRLLALVDSLQPPGSASGR